MERSNKFFVLSSVMVTLILISLNYSEMQTAYTYGAAMNSLVVKSNFPYDDNQFQKIYGNEESTCFTTPNNNQFCYEKPRLHGSGILISHPISQNGIIGEMHFDPVNRGVGYFTMTNMTQVKGDKAIVSFADKDYSIGNKDRTTYEITEDFEYSAEIDKFDTFITHCGNFEGTAATVVQYLGIVTIDGIDYFVTWHTVATSETGILCKYPELIHYSLKHNFEEL